MCDYQSTSVLDTEVGRQRLVTTALKLTENTAIAPKLYERSLLEKFVAGTLTIDEVIALLEGQQGQGA
jgi:hypothetical protein